MRPEQDDAGVVFRWIRADVGDALVQCEENAAITPDQFEHDLVRSSGQTFILEPLGLVTRSAKIFEELYGEVFVELEPHTGLSGRRLSSRASSAA